MFHLNRINQKVKKNSNDENHESFVRLKEKQEKSLILPTLVSIDL